MIPYSLATFAIRFTTEWNTNESKDSDPLRKIFFHTLGTMRLAGENVGSDFFSSLSTFKNFDKNLNIVQSEQVAAVASMYENTVPYEALQPLAPPVLLQGEWVDGRFVEK